MTADHFRQPARMMKGDAMDATDAKLIDAVARAISQEIATQWDATPAPGREWDPDSWTATGGVLDLVPVAQAAIAAVFAELKNRGIKVVGRESEGDKFPMRDHPMSMNRIGACVLWDCVRDRVAGLDQAARIWRAMWDAAPWVPASAGDEWPICPECEGRGYIAEVLDGGPEPPCRACGGRGWIKSADKPGEEG